jgi:hypothetical protein
MNSLERRFPLPDLESHKLDEIKQNLSETTVNAPRFTIFAGVTPVMGITLIGLAGLLTWALIRGRKPQGRSC